MSTAVCFPLGDRLACLAADRRFEDLPRTRTPAFLRELIAATLEGLASGRHPRQAWREAAAGLGLGRRELALLVLADTPTYVGAVCPADQQVCSHRMTAGARRGLACGVQAVESVVDYAADGAWVSVWRCHDHRGELWSVGEDARRRKAAGLVPEPAPNRGGLLADYLPMLDWAAVYGSSRSGSRAA